MKKRILLAITASTFLLAQEKELEKTELEAISVVEQSETGFDFKEAVKTQPRNVGELLKNEASIEVSGATPNAKRFYMRGISDSLSNVTIDGAKQSKDLHQHRGALSSIDTDILKAVHVNPGVSPSDAGTGNMGGVIRFETVDAQDLLEDGKDYGAFVKTTLGSIDDSYKNSLALYGKLHDNIGILVYGNKADSDNYETGSGREVLASAEEVENYLLKLSMINLNSHSLKVSHEKNTQEGLYKFGSTGSDFGYLTDENEAVPQKVVRKTSIANYNFNPENNLVNTSFKIYKNDTDLENLDSKTKYSSEGSGADIRNTFSFSNNLFTNNLTVGVDYEKEEGKGTHKTVTDENRGIFVQNRMIFNDFNLSFGARYDDYENDFVQKKFSGDEISSNINGEYFLTDNLSLFAGYGETISATNTVPVGWLTDNKPLTFNGSTNGDLELQKAQKYEVGTNIEFKDTFKNEDSLNLKVTLFDTTIENPITRHGGGMAPRVDIWNDPDIESQGVEVRTSYLIDNFKTSLSYAHTKVKQDGTEIEGAQRRTAGSYGDRIVADFGYDVSKNLGFGYTIVGALKNDNPPSGSVNNKAGYAIHNLNASFTPQEFKNLTFSLAVNNLFDKDYSAHTSYVANGEAVGEPGRDVRVSLKYKF